MEKVLLGKNEWRTLAGQDNARVASLGCPCDSDRFIGARVLGDGEGDGVDQRSGKSKEAGTSEQGRLDKKKKTNLRELNIVRAVVDKERAKSKSRNLSFIFHNTHKHGDRLITLRLYFNISAEFPLLTTLHIEGCGNTSSNGRVSLKQLSHTSLTALSAVSVLGHAGFAATEITAVRRAHASTVCVQPLSRQGLNKAAWEHAPDAASKKKRIPPAAVLACTGNPRSNYSPESLNISSVKSIKKHYI